MRLFVNPRRVIFPSYTVTFIKLPVSILIFQSRMSLLACYESEENACMNTINVN